MTDDTLLFRQIHPNFVQDGFASSVAFRPNEADQGLMSVYDGDLILPEASWSHYTSILKKRSVGVVTLVVGECKAEGLPPRPDTDPFPEHAVVDFTGLDEKHWRGKSKKLQAKALARGWAYLPPPVE